MTCPSSDLGCMFHHEASPVCHFKEKCSKRLCQFQHSELGGRNQNSCEKCEKIFDSDECLTTHIQEIHTEKNAAEIDLDLYVETNLPELFNLYLTNNRHVKCYFCDFE